MDHHKLLKLGSFGTVILIFLFSIINRLVYQLILSGFSQIGVMGLDSAFYHELATQFSQSWSFSQSFL